MEYIPGILFFLLILIILAIIAPPLICLMAGGIDVLLVSVVWLLNWLDSAIVLIWELITAAVGFTIQAPAAVIVLVGMIVLGICTLITNYEAGDDLYEEDPETGEKNTYCFRV